MPTERFLFVIFVQIGTGIAVIAWGDNGWVNNWTGFWLGFSFCTLCRDWEKIKMGQ